MNRIIGIDPGVRGLSYVMLENGRLVDGDVTDLCAGTRKNYYTMSDYECWAKIQEWWAYHIERFAAFRPDAIVIEHQRVYQGAKKKGRMTGVLWCISTLFWVITPHIHWVAPKEVKQRFQIAMGEHKRNKQAAVQEFERREGEQLKRSERYMKQWTEKQKSDVADAYFIALYRYQSQSPHPNHHPRISPLP